MKSSFEPTLIEVGEKPSSKTPTRSNWMATDTLSGALRNAVLRQVDFVLDGIEIRGLEQNPQTKSRWAQMAGSGKEAMQFLSEGRYVNVVDGKVTLYGR